MEGEARGHKTKRRRSAGDHAYRRGSLLDRRRLVMHRSRTPGSPGAAAG